PKQLGRHNQQYCVRGSSLQGSVPVGIPRERCGFEPQHYHTLIPESRAANSHIERRDPLHRGPAMDAVEQRREVVMAAFQSRHILIPCEQHVEIKGRSAKAISCEASLPGEGTIECRPYLRDVAPRLILYRRLMGGIVGEATGTLDPHQGGLASHRR